ncbi:MAG TPA: aspartate carbamoyltransferase catalytic subunit [Alphaproteobacteria bacterium]|nr:aspartate carbamoyltransferase catalytic subunit [Alphaproteobacteria bacterium]
MTGSYKFKHKHLLDIKTLSRSDIEHILSLSEKYIKQPNKPIKKSNILEGKTLINLFFENSTRTRTSFELAGKRLGVDVINMDVDTSSAKKGETLIDTALTLNAMHPDFIVIRHSESGAPELLSQKLNCSVINAGDGWNAHPTQALLDALTIKRNVGSFKNLQVVIAGDILHSRVARSNIQLLNKMGAKVKVAAPRTLLPSGIEKLGVEVFDNLDDAIVDADIVMMLRLQKERMSGAFIPSGREYFYYFGLDERKLKKAKKNVFVMHPGPINRGVEIASEIADDINHSLILQQVEMGVCVRQAILEALV